jgi:hypothetical protein
MQQLDWDTATWGDEVADAAAVPRFGEGSETSMGPV